MFPFGGMSISLQLSFSCGHVRGNAEQEFISQADEEYTAALMSGDEVAMINLLKNTGTCSLMQMVLALGMHVDILFKLRSLAGFSCGFGCKKMFLHMCVFLTLLHGF